MARVSLTLRGPSRGQQFDLSNLIYYTGLLSGVIKDHRGVTSGPASSAHHRVPAPLHMDRDPFIY